MQYSDFRHTHTIPTSREQKRRKKESTKRFVAHIECFSCCCLFLSRHLRLWHVNFVNDNGQIHANTANTGVFAVSARICHLVTGAKWNLCVCKCLQRDESHARRRGMSNWNVNGIVQSCSVLLMQWSVSLPLSSLFHLFRPQVFICSVLRSKAVPPNHNSACLLQNGRIAYTMQRTTHAILD